MKAKIIGVIVILMFLGLIVGEIYGYFQLGQKNQEISQLTQSQTAVVGYIQESIALGIFPSINQLQQLASSTKK